MKTVAEHLSIGPSVCDPIDRSLLNTTTSPTPNRLEVAPKQMAQLKSTYNDDQIQLESLLNHSFGEISEIEPANTHRIGPPGQEKNL